MIDAAVREKNRQYWDGAADNWFGATALPEYGVYCVTEDELHFFDGVQGKRLLEVGCGSVLNPGTVVGRGARIYPLSMVRGYVPGFSIYKRAGEIAEIRD